MKTNRSILLRWLDQDEICHGGDKEDFIDEYGVYLTITDAMEEARIDTLLHLKDQMLVNAKKLTGESCVKLVEQLIEEIKKP